MVEQFKHSFDIFFGASGSRYTTFDLISIAVCLVVLLFMSLYIKKRNQGGNK